MSAFVVSDRHISYLVNAAIQYNRRGRALVTWGEERVETGLRQEVGQALLDENTKSVNHRYNETGDATTYQHTNTSNIDALHVLSLINGYRYQACEHPRWAGSPAWCFCNQLERAAIRALPGYEEAPWSI
jgi:hypothetical protein